MSAEINFPCPATVGEPAVFSHLARVQYLHTAQLVGCWEQIGIRITQSVILFRVRHASDSQNQNRTVNHWCLSTPYTKEMLSTPTFTVALLEPSRFDKHDNQ